MSLRERLRAVSPWVWLAAVLIVAWAFEIPFWATVTLAVVTVIGAVTTAGSKRLQEWFERKPSLALVVAGVDDDGVLRSGLPPWPFDDEAIVTHQVAGLREFVAASERLNSGRRLGTPLTALPSQAALDRAREQYEEELSGYESALRSWLSEYRAAADLRSRTFTIAVAVSNARSGAYAEDVRLDVDLPEGLIVADDLPVMTLPPEPPEYVPPKAFSAFDTDALDVRARYTGAGIPWVRESVDLIKGLAPGQAAQWQVLDGGRRLSVTPGNVHAGAKVDVDDSVIVTVPSVGMHRLDWTMYSRSGRVIVRGEISLEAAAPKSVPAFTRLGGLLAYPDVPLVDADGEVRTPVRAADSELDPPTSEDRSTTGRLRERDARRRWDALGLPGAGSSGPEGGTGLE
jgi:hypothetical protein